MSKYLKSVSFNYKFDLINTKSIREIATLYLYIINNTKVNTNGVSQVILENSEDLLLEEFGNSLRCAHPLKYINLLSENPTDEDIKKSFTNEVKDILYFIGKSRGWDIIALEKISDEIERRMFKFYGSLGRAKSSPDKQKTAAITWNTDEYINIGVSIKSKHNNNEDWIRVIKIGIGLGLFESICGKLEWDNDNIVKMYHSNKRDYWEVDVKNKLVRFHYPRAENDDPHGQYDLAKMYIDGWLVEKDIGMAVYWLEKSAAQGFGRAVKLLERIQSGEVDLSDPIKNSLK